MSGSQIINSDTLCSLVKGNTEKPERATFLLDLPEIRRLTVIATQACAHRTKPYACTKSNSDQTRMSALYWHVPSNNLQRISCTQLFDFYGLLIFNVCNDTGIILPSNEPRVLSEAIEVTTEAGDSNTFLRFQSCVRNSVSKTLIRP